jgi:flagellar hook protein FlgE
MHCANGIQTAASFKLALLTLVSPWTCRAATVIPTGVQSDLAIIGDGYFVITQGDERLLTRHGRLSVDWDGRFRLWSGPTVLGYPPGAGSPGEFKIDFSPGPSNPPAAVESYQVLTNGTLLIRYTNGDELPAARLALWLPPEPARLERTGDAEFKDPHLLADDWEDHLVPVGTAGAGWIQAGAYELPELALRIARFDRSPAGPQQPAVVITTGLQSHLYLDGPGFFEVRDPATDQRLLTRSGAFKEDQEGWLVTLEHGYRLQGWTNLWAQDPEAEVPLLKGDLHVGWGLPPPGPVAGIDLGHLVTSYHLCANGVFEMRVANGSVYAQSRTTLWGVPEPDNLVAVGPGLYALPAAEHGALIVPGEASADTTTWVRSGHLDYNSLTEALLAGWRKQTRGLQGAVQRVGDSDFMAISGRGFFVLRDQVLDRTLYTRLGIFRWTKTGHLEGPGGWRVQGCGPEEIPCGDVQLPAIPGHTITALDVTPDGQIHLKWTDGSLTTWSRLSLALIRDPTLLKEIAPYCYELPAEVGATPLRHFPGDAGLGHVLSGALEEVWNHTNYLPESLPQRGVILTAWGKVGRDLRLQSGSVLSPQSPLGFWWSYGTRFPQSGYVIISTAGVVPSEFYRLEAEPSEAVP